MKNPPTLGPIPAIARIARQPRQGGDPLGFEPLRELALQYAQAASGTLWTDYNLHDPGVTLLEALCYTLTEEVYATRESVPALLGLSEAPGTASPRHGLPGPAEVLPCRPCTRARSTIHTETSSCIVMAPPS